MAFEKTPAGTRGQRMPGVGSPVAKWLNKQMIKRQRRKSSGGGVPGQNTLVLTTTGAKTGQPRETLLGSFPDGDDAWLIVASFGGNAKNPAWYHNLAAHPDQVADRGRRPEGQGDAGPAVRRRPRGGLAAHHRGQQPLRRLRDQDRPGDPGHPPHGGRLTANRRARVSGPPPPSAAAGAAASSGAPARRGRRPRASGRRNPRARPLPPPPRSRTSSRGWPPAPRPPRGARPWAARWPRGRSGTCPARGLPASR